MKHQRNSHRFMMYEFKHFKPTSDQRIEMGEEEVRLLCLGKSQIKEQNDLMTSKQNKDLTYYIRTLVQKNFE
jgi:hypothetical protein